MMNPERQFPFRLAIPPVPVVRSVRSETEAVTDENVRRCLVTEIAKTTGKSLFEIPNHLFLNPPGGLHFTQRQPREHSQRRISALILSMYRRFSGGGRVS